MLAKGNGSADLISKVVSNYFRIPVVEVEPWIRREMTVPASQCNKMGINNSRLGDDFVMGDSIHDCSGKYLLHLRELDLPQYRNFLPGAAGFSELVELIQYLMIDALDYDICLHLSEHAGRCTDSESSLGHELGWNLTLGGAPHLNTAEPARICVADYHSL